jgi:hypothetical protein
MLLYHASTTTVEKPEIVNRSNLLDFGTGFYTTPNEEQARDFAIKAFLRRGRRGIPTVNIYECDDLRMLQGLALQEFVEPDLEWLAFVVQNRREGRLHNDADIIIGPVANDNVFRTIVLYMSGNLDEKAALNAFKVKELYRQVLFCNEQALKLLDFKTSYALEVPQ